MAESHIGCYKTELIKIQRPGGAPTTSNWRLPNGSTGSTTADSTSTAEIPPAEMENAHPAQIKASNPLSSQTDESPDMPGRFTHQRPRQP